MKQTLLGTILAVAALAAICPLRAQLNVFSDGSDGALNVSSGDLQIDLSQAVQGIWSANNSTNTGKGIWDPNKRAIVFKYASVNIAANRNVSFKNHPNRPPVVWLVQGDVNIAGRLSLDGSAATENYKLAEPGPGGFRGGATVSGPGLGPGGSNGVSGGTLIAAKFASIYGNPQILPLIGGSGSGATPYTSPRAGGGGGQF